MASAFSTVMCFLLLLGAVFNSHGVKTPENVDGRANFNKDYDKRVHYGYSFDDYNGNQQSKQETIDSSATTGEYRTILSDGRLQIVTYTADENGFRPKYSYEHPKSANEEVATSSVTTAANAAAVRGKAPVQLVDEDKPIKKPLTTESQPLTYISKGKERAGVSYKEPLQPIGTASTQQDKETGNAPSDNRSPGSPKISEGNEDNFRYHLIACFKRKQVMYGYSLNDYEGNEQSKHETIDGNKVVGEYRVLIPDGRLQVVSYTADENGYHPRVEYIARKTIRRPKHQEENDNETPRMDDNADAAVKQTKAAYVEPAEERHLLDGITENNPTIIQEESIFESLSDYSESDDQEEEKNDEEFYRSLFPSTDFIRHVSPMELVRRIRFALAKYLGDAKNCQFPS